MLSTSGEENVMMDASLLMGEMMKSNLITTCYLCLCLLFSACDSKDDHPSSTVTTQPMSTVPKVTVSTQPSIGSVEDYQRKLIDQLAGDDAIDAFQKILKEDPEVIKVLGEYLDDSRPSPASMMFAIKGIASVGWICEVLINDHLYPWMRGKYEQYFFSLNGQDLKDLLAMHADSEFKAIQLAALEIALSKMQADVSARNERYQKWHAEKKALIQNEIAKIEEQ